MTKRQKLEKAIRENARQVRYADLNTLMNQCNFNGFSDGSSHVKYVHRVYTDISAIVVKPHGGATHVKPVYVAQALAAIDTARGREGDRA